LEEKTMDIMNTVFKNVRPQSLRWLGLGAIAGATVAVVSSVGGMDLAPWLGTVVGIATGGFLFAESGVKGFSMPSGWKSFVHLGSAIVGIGVLVVTLLPLAGVSVPMAVATAAAWSSPFIVAELFV
jgi:hypothetical protein